MDARCLPEGGMLRSIYLGLQHRRLQTPARGNMNMIWKILRRFAKNSESVRAALHSAIKDMAGLPQTESGRHVNESLGGSGDRHPGFTCNTAATLAAPKRRSLPSPARREGCKSPTPAVMRRCPAGPSQVNFEHAPSKPVAIHRSRSPCAAAATALRKTRTIGRSRSAEYYARSKRRVTPRARPDLYDQRDARGQ